MARARKKTDKPTGSKRPIKQYEHKGQQRKNNPPVGLVTEATDRDFPRQQYAYDPHLDPTLTWAGKAEHTSFQVPTVSLHVHERIDPKTIIEAVRRRNGTPADVLALFGSVLRDDFRPDSDIDVLVEFEPGTRLGFAFFDVEQELSQILGRRVDLRTAQELSKYFRDEVLAEAEEVYVAA